MSAGEQTYQPGDAVEVNLAGLRPLAFTEVLVDPEAHGTWHPGVITAVLPDGRYAVEIMPLVGAIEAPPVEAARLRRR